MATLAILTMRLSAKLTHFVKQAKVDCAVAVFFVGYIAGTRHAHTTYLQMLLPVA